jgi:hypothetical protein
MISDRTTFLSAMTSRSIIIALRATRSPSVLCLILRCGLPVDMILQKKQTRFAKKKKSKRNNLVSVHRKSGIITAIKRTFPKITNRKYHNTVHNNTEPDNPNTTNISNMHKRIF